MSVLGRSVLYGHEGYVHGHVITGVSYSSHTQARLLQAMLEREMRERAGKPEEALLAKWYNEIEHDRRRARRDNWRGWEKPL